MGFIFIFASCDDPLGLLRCNTDLLFGRACLDANFPTPGWGGTTAAEESCNVINDDIAGHGC